MASVKIDASIKVRESQPDMPLDYAVFQLTPTRTRCELLVALHGREEKLTSGLIEPFSNHLKALGDKISDGNYIVKLQPMEDEQCAAWFTKGTMERFVRFVDAPELLERACAVEDELSQLEETLNTYTTDDAAHSGTAVPSSDSKSLPATGPDSDSDEVQIGETDTTRLRHSLENRRDALRNEESMVFSRARASGFTLENLRELEIFARQFGAVRLQEACGNFIVLLAKTHVSNELFEPGYAVSPALDAQNMDSSTTGSSKIPARVTAEISGSKENESTAAVTERRLSVQEKITMFERSMGAGHVRRSMDTGDKCTSEKPVLRRWSLAHEKLLPAEGPRASRRALENDVSPVLEDVDTAKSPSTGREHISDEAVSESAVEAESTSEEVSSVSFQTEELQENADGPSPENKAAWIQNHEGDEDKTSVGSDTQSLNDSKGRLYNEYRQKRDAKLKEAGSGKAERQARLKMMQETLERRRAEINKSAKKTNPHVEAQSRAAKLRAFKAEMLELKKVKEEEDRKRLEALRLQRLKRVPTQSPRSPRFAGTTPKPGAAKGLLPSFQKASATSRNPQHQKLAGKNQNAVSQSVPSLSEFRKISAKPAGISRQDTATAGGGGAKVNNKVLRKSVSSLNEAKTGMAQLKLSRNLMPEQEETSTAAGSRMRSQSFKVSRSTTVWEEQPQGVCSGIRARVTSEDEVFEDEQEEHEQEDAAAAAAAADEPYQAPVAPVSASSPLVLQA